MIYQKKTAFILFLLLLMGNTSLYAQEFFSNEIVINWQKDSKNSVSSEAFEFAIESESNPKLPAYHYTMSLDNDEIIEISLSDISVSAYETKINEQFKFSDIEDEFNYSIRYLYDRGNKTADIRIETYRKKNNKIEQLEAFSINSSIKRIKGTSSTKRTYADNSVLASGDWYKIKITKSGIYRVSGSDLLSMGFSLSALDINSIRLYGNGGGMLPEANSAFRYDDIVENSIQIHDANSNGIFESSDYFIFYGKGPNTWKFSEVSKYFFHQKNIYDSYAYYFITIKSGLGKRIENDSNTYSVANTFVNKFTDYAFLEKDSLNLIKTGREWYGEHYSIENSHKFYFTFPNIVNNEAVFIKTNTIARSTLNSTMYFNINGLERTISYTPTGTNYLGYYATSVVDTFSFLTSNSKISINSVYSKPSTSSQAWMNYIAINVRRHLTMSGTQMRFCDPKSVSIGNTVEYTLENAKQNTQIWEISNHISPQIMANNLSSTTMTFVASADSLRSFIAHNGGYLSPIKVGNLNNQNLHSLSNIDYIILYDKKFESQAEKLANYHRTNSNLTVYKSVLSPVYNEFGSGAKDNAAIRDFIKMLYDKAGGDVAKMPKYLLLFGDASYDYKNRIPNNTNLIPTYESRNSLLPTGSFCTDDFFGLLDDGEGAYANGDLDIGIGRFPVSTVAMANDVINKILSYHSTGVTGNGTSCSNGFNSPKNMADWRNKVCFIGDDEDLGVHTAQADYLANYTITNYPVYNVDKIFFDAYTQVITPGGQRYPDVKRAINQAVEKGNLVLNYTGHGGEEGWSHESVLEVNDIQSWSNLANLPLFITATCEFSRYDDPERISAGEYVLLNPEGGGIGLLTTSRVSWSSSNFSLNKVIIRELFKKENGKYPRLGDIVRKSKVGSGSIYQNKNFVLLGDPAMNLTYPKDEIITTSISDSKTGIEIDTIKALQQITINGEVHKAGSVNPLFNGEVDITIFDKSKTYSTLGNDPGSPIYNFELQKSIIYKGKVKASNGAFNFDFVVPRDIAYNFGNGKISYYATNDTIDANGYSDSLIIGGSYELAEDDFDGPIIDLYINNTSFINNGITDENPSLLAFVFDEHGINTIGNGIGHDLTAILDSKSTNPIILNEYYKAELGDFKKGIISYPFYKLEEGPHSLDIKVWDVYNNSAKASIDFIVASSSEMAMDNLFNAPNPFTDNTSIVFEHNRGCDILDVEVFIYNNTGQLVHKIITSVNSSGYRVGPGEIVWDGTSNNGSTLTQGIYIYTVRYEILNEEGEKEYKELNSKMVLLK